MDACWRVFFNGLANFNWLGKVRKTKGSIEKIGVCQKNICFYLFISNRIILEHFWEISLEIPPPPKKN